MFRFGGCGRGAGPSCLVHACMPGMCQLHAALQWQGHCTLPYGGGPWGIGWRAASAMHTTHSLRPQVGDQPGSWPADWAARPGVSFPGEEPDAGTSVFCLCSTWFCASRVGFSLESFPWERCMAPPSCSSSKSLAMSASSSPLPKVTCLHPTRRLRAAPPAQDAAARDHQC
jgi:hypothetical protein